MLAMIGQSIANPTQPQHSTSKVSSSTLSEDTDATQVSGSKVTVTGKKQKPNPPPPPPPKVRAIHPLHVNTELWSSPPPQTQNTV